MHTHAFLSMHANTKATQPVNTETLLKSHTLNTDTTCTLIHIFATLKLSLTHIRVSH